MAGDEMKNKTLEEIGSRLASARKDKGYTQEQLANLSGLSTKMISAAENGHKAMRRKTSLNYANVYPSLLIVYYVANL